MTPYQQSLVKEGKAKTLKMQTLKVLSSFVMILLGVAFYARSMGKIPEAFDGWLMIVAAGFVILNVAFTALVGLLYGSSLLTYFTMDQIKNDPMWNHNSQSAALSYKCRKLTVTLVTRVKVISWLQWDFISVLDAFADVFLFTALVTANHPWIAAFNGITIATQYYFAFKTKKVVMEMIKLLPDPLEQTSETDIDDLMDKLCNPKEKQ